MSGAVRLQHEAGSHSAASQGGEPFGCNPLRRGKKHAKKLNERRFGATPPAARSDDGGLPKDLVFDGSHSRRATIEAGHGTPSSDSQWSHVLDVLAFFCQSRPRTLSAVTDIVTQAVAMPRGMNAVAGCGGG